MIYKEINQFHIFRDLSHFNQLFFWNIINIDKCNSINNKLLNRNFAENIKVVSLHVIAFMDPTLASSTIRNIVTTILTDTRERHRKTKEVNTKLSWPKYYLCVIQINGFPPRKPCDKRTLRHRKNWSHLSTNYQQGSTRSREHLL